LNFSLHGWKFADFARRRQSRQKRINQKTASKNSKPATGRNVRLDRNGVLQ
jgi:hypothetical protein